MGNLLDKKEQPSPMKEPQLASEKSEIPPDTRTPQLTKESLEIQKINESKEKEKNEPQNEEKENEPKEEDIPEEQEDNQEQEEIAEEDNQEHDENIEEENQDNEENIEEENQQDSPRDGEEEEQYIKINEGEEINQAQDFKLITPPKGKVYKFMQEGQWFQVDDKGQLYKIIQEGEGENQRTIIKQLNPVKQEENMRETPEVQKLVLKSNNNDINYQMSSQRSKTRSSNRFKKKEPRDSNPKVHILSGKKMQNENNNYNNIYNISSSSIKQKKNLNNNENIIINSEFVEVPRDQYENIDNNQTIILGKGMDTGEYKFLGEKAIIKENLIPSGKITITQEEILEELNRRKKKKKSKEKKIKYEVIDKFYALTDINGKTIRRVAKSGYNKKIGNNEINYNNLHKNYFYSSLSSNTNNIQTNINNTIGNDINSINMNFPMQYMNMNMMNNINMMNFMKSMQSYQSMQSLPQDNYSRYFLEQINKLRTEPQSFIGVIEDAKANITKDQYGRLIYNSKIKVALNLGEKAFDEAINYLKNIYPMEPLIYNQLITVNVPSNENDILDKDDLSKKVDGMIQCGVNIKSYWRDVIKDPEISFLLMIIDDNGIKSGMRRKDILSPSIKYIGINSNEINNHFVCYVTLGN